MLLSRRKPSVHFEQRPRAECAVHGKEIYSFGSLGRSACAPQRKQRALLGPHLRHIAASGGMGVGVGETILVTELDEAEGGKDYIAVVPASVDFEEAARLINEGCSGLICIIL